MAPSPLQMAGWAHADVGLVHQFVQQFVRPAVTQACTRVDGGGGDGRSAEDATVFFGYTLRLASWLRALVKSNEPADFQPASTATRALFEMAIDLTLLHHDPAATPSRMLDWQESEKLKTARQALEYFALQPTLPEPAECTIYSRFVASHGQRIEQRRIANWSKPQHPKRWTGRDSLLADATAADAYDPQFVRYYRTRFGELSWYTHGTALTGIIGLDEQTFPAVIGRAFIDAAAFAVLIARYVMSAPVLGCWSPTTEHAFADLESDRAKLVHERLHDS